MTFVSDMEMIKFIDMLEATRFDSLDKIGSLENEIKIGIATRTRTPKQVGALRKELSYQKGQYDAIIKVMMAMKKGGVKC